ncbi:MAG: flagellar basal body P-ring protein FlgI [Desulfobacteraceae bacterium]|nr:flagellar basal body P-ring protein FlgI [Desulfobacteraceae bacterium]MBC2752866.1 flagellar basal body P-ring protein FlgI [Desulfobacteraceae bacterium]
MDVRYPSQWKIRILAVICLGILLVAVGSDAAHAARIKDIANIRGVRQNQLFGYGLVVGLDGSGDGNKSLFTVQSLASMLEKMGVTIDPDDLKVKNVAAVMITADLPPFARTGSRIDVLVNSIGDAKNLQGGTLLLTPLKGADGKVYAVAQGPVSTGGFSYGKGTGTGVQKNFPTVANIVGGALIEREIANNFNERELLTLALHAPDFTTATRMAQAINAAFGDALASAPDAGTIEVKVPDLYRGRSVELVALIENIGVTPDMVSKIIINERTGTVIMGENVRIATIAIAHGNLSIQVNRQDNVSQPLPFSRGGQTVVTSDRDLVVQEGSNPLFLVESGVSIGEVVRALNALGVSPRDLIAIFQALKAAGALQAELQII